MNLNSTINLTPIYISKENIPLIYLSQCPGKNFMNSKGKLFNRSLNEDLEFIKKTNIKVIVNLLNLYELRTLGVKMHEYKHICNELEIMMISFPIIEMGIPSQNIQEIDNTLINQLAKFITNNEPILIHCRGGVGRAGLISGLLLRKLEKYNNYEECLTYLRTIRHKKCVESMKQRDYLKKYFEYQRINTKINRIN